MINCDVYDDDDIYDEVYGDDDVFDEVDGDDDNLEDVWIRSWTVAGVDPSGVDAQPPHAIQYQPTEQHKYRWKYKDNHNENTTTTDAAPTTHSTLYFFLCILIRIFLYLH